MNKQEFSNINVGDIIKYNDYYGIVTKKAFDVLTLNWFGSLTYLEENKKVLSTDSKFNFKDLSYGNSCVFRKAKITNWKRRIENGS